MFGQIYFRVLGIGCFLSMALLLSAQSKLDSLHHLNEVVVTARINKEVIPVQSLSGDKLEKLAAHSVADAIRYFSGVQIKDYGGIGGLKTVNIRSMGTNHVGVFYDGIELGNAQNGVIDLGRFSLDNMEAVTLYKVLIYISTLENHRKGWSREIPEPVFSIYLTILFPLLSKQKPKTYLYRLLLLPCC